MTLSFSVNIRPHFREGDIKCMGPAGIKLDDSAWMCLPANAQNVYDQISTGRMPPDAPWPPDRISLLKKWMDAGCPA